jgi:hypothetical protein
MVLGTFIPGIIAGKRGEEPTGTRWGPRELEYQTLLFLMEL